LVVVIGPKMNRAHVSVHRLESTHLANPAEVQAVDRRFSRWIPEVVFLYSITNWIQ